MEGEAACNKLPRLSPKRLQASSFQCVRQEPPVSLDMKLRGRSIQHIENQMLANVSVSSGDLRCSLCSNIFSTSFFPFFLATAGFMLGSSLPISRQACKHHREIPKVALVKNFCHRHVEISSFGVYLSSKALVCELP